MRPAWIAVFGIILVSALLSLYYAPQVQDPMITHWGAAGEPNGAMDKAGGLWIIPGIMLLLALMFWIIPGTDPLKKNIESFRRYFDLFVVLMFLFLLNLHYVVLSWNTGSQTDMALIMCVWFGILFYYAGLLCAKSRRNWFIGVRTPWTMSSDRVWDKTNKRVGFLFQVSAFFIIISALLRELAFLVLIAAMIVIGLYAVAYSYREYKREQTRKAK